MILTPRQIATVVKTLYPEERAYIDRLQRGPLPRIFVAPPPGLIEIDLVEFGDDGVPFLTELGVQIGIGLQEDDEHGGTSA